ncbi:hypothetical protein [Ammoniphilus sp. 3BR4]|uniref:hypothetical protein n=1 Tax=Ammoniphilus sp. 3BR4 TaxID=3158265 RepID=UPI0034678704
MTLYDTLINWLQLWLVVESRPHDEAAKQSMEHVADILNQNYQVSIVEVVKDSSRYQVKYTKNGVDETQQFPQEAAEVLLSFINENPERYDFN